MFKFFRATNIFITKPGEALIVHTILLYHKPISDCIIYQIDFCKILVKRILAKTLNSGPSDRNRTCGLLNPIQARYQTAPHPVMNFNSSNYIINKMKIKWKQVSWGTSSKIPKIFKHNYVIWT